MAIIQEVKDGKLVENAAAASASKKTAAKAGGALDKDAFLQLLVAQMQYQDPLEPTDNTEYISQLATFSQLEETQNLSKTVVEDSAYSLVGKHVIMKVTNAQTGDVSYADGQVDRVLRQNGSVYLSINDSLYDIEDLDEVVDDAYYIASLLGHTFTQEVQALPNVNMLTLSDEAKITELRKGYDQMTTYQKTFVSKDTMDRFLELETRMEELKKQAGTQPGEETGEETGEASE